MPWEQGKSGNPSGRPKYAAEIRELARKQTEAAIKALTEVMDTGPDQSRVAAARELLDRGYGKTPAEDYISLPEFIGTLAERGEHIIAAVAKGILPLSTGERMQAMLEKQARIVEVTELGDVLALYEKEFHSGARPILQPHVLPQAQN